MGDAQEKHQVSRGRARCERCGYDEFAAFLITFREAMEAILIVGVILTYIRRIGEARWSKWVWTGVILALAAS